MDGSVEGVVMMLNKNGYPTDEAITHIKQWGAEDPKGLIEFIRELWRWPDWGFVLKGKRVLRLELHTGGWSGNEDIINALNNNIFWTLYWMKSKRGGHHYFRIPLSVASNDESNKDADAV